MKPDIWSQLVLNLQEIDLTIPSCKNKCGHSVPIVRPFSSGNSLNLFWSLIFSYWRRKRTAKKGKLSWHVWVASWNIKKLGVLPGGWMLFCSDTGAFLFCFVWNRRSYFDWLELMLGRIWRLGTAWVVIWNLRIVRESLGGKGAALFLIRFFFFFPNIRHLIWSLMHNGCWFIGANA